MSQYFPELCGHCGENEKVEFDLTNYGTKTDLKGAAGIDTFMLASKTDLAGLKNMVDKFDINKFKTVSADLSKLSNAVDNDVV